MNETDRLVVRIMQREDVELARSLHNDDSVLRNLTDPRHVSVISQEMWFDAVSSSKTSMRYAVYERSHVAPETFVGIFRVDALDMINKSVMVGMDVAKNKRGNSYATETYEYFLSYFFNTLGMNRLWLLVLESNVVARALYDKLGFVEEGRQRCALWRNGKYEDYVMMSMLSSEFMLLKQDTQ